MLIFSITKRVNKALAPKLLSWSLRLHESLSSSSSLPFSLSPNSISMLPLAQRLVSIEVQDDYRQLKNHEKLTSTSSSSSSSSSPWDNFIDQSWNVFFENRHQKLKADRQRETEQEQAAEAEAQRLWEVKQQKRRQRQNQKQKMRSASKDDGTNEGLLHELLSEQRVQILDEYIRPALFPTAADSKNGSSRHLFTCHQHEQNSNTQQQQNNTQSESTHYHYSNFVKWIRGEYLIAKYGLAVQKAVKHHPELRDDAAGLSTVELESDEELLKLPSVGTIREAFGMKDWNRRKVPISSWEDADKGVNLPDGRNDDDFTIEQIIHTKLQGQIVDSGPLNAYFEMRKREDSYELWTRDYIFGLAKYLLDRIAEMDGDGHDNEQQPTKTIILDVGAGDGRLAYFLRQAMKEMSLLSTSKHGKSNRPKEESTLSMQHPQSSLPIIIATDDGSWKAPLYTNSQIRVEQLSAIEALNKYAPIPVTQEDEDTEKTRLIVLCSWMPPGQDWTADFRRKPVKAKGTTGDENSIIAGVERLAEEYILIGEADDGTCGHNWLTWGNPDFITEDDEVGQKVDVPHHESDGYKRVDLEELSLMQFSRFDCKRSSESMTVSFRRGESKNRK